MLCAAFMVADMVMLERTLYWTAELGHDRPSAPQACALAAVALVEMLCAYVVTRAVDRILMLAGELRGYRPQQSVPPAAASRAR